MHGSLRDTRVLLPFCYHLAAAGGGSSSSRRKEEEGGAAAAAGALGVAAAGGRRSGRGTPSHSLKVLKAELVPFGPFGIQPLCLGPGRRPGLESRLQVQGADAEAAGGRG